MEQKKHAKLYIGLFIAFIMVTSIFGFIGSYQSEQESSFEYNGFTFYQTNRGFYTKLNDNKIFFYYEPQQLEAINISTAAKNLVSNLKVISLTYDPSSTLKKTLGGIQYEFSSILYNTMGIIVQAGLTDNSGYKVPEIGCTNSTPFAPVILFKDGEDGYKVEDSCLIITSDTDAGFVKLYNRLLYTILGVFQ